MCLEYKCEMGAMIDEGESDGFQVKDQEILWAASVSTHLLGGMISRTHTAGAAWKENCLEQGWEVPDALR